MLQESFIHNVPRKQGGLRRRKGRQVTKDFIESLAGMIVQAAGVSKVQFLTREVLLLDGLVAATCKRRCVKQLGTFF